MKKLIRKERSGCMSRSSSKKITKYQRLESLFAKCDNILKAKEDETKKMKDEKVKRGEKK